MKSTKKFSRVIAFLLLPLPFLLAAMVLGETYLRILGPEQIPPYSPCMKFDPHLRLRYQPNCRFFSDSAQGKVEYVFNEVGLRDPKPKQSPKQNGVIAVLGDSITEGLFLREDQTIPRKLETYVGAPVLNAGIRFTSPSVQYRIFEQQVEPNYAVRAVVWLLNAGDVSDERLFQAEALSKDEHGIPLTYPWLASDGMLGKSLVRVSQWNAGRSYLVNTVVRLATFGVYLRRAQKTEPTKENLCRAVRQLSEKLKNRKIPLLIIFTPHFIKGFEANWPGYSYNAEEMNRFVSCTRESGSAVEDLSNAEISADMFAADLIHFNPKGADWFAKLIAPKVASLLRKN